MIPMVPWSWLRDPRTLPILVAYACFLFGMGTWFGVVIAQRPTLEAEMTFLIVMGDINTLSQQAIADAAEQSAGGLLLAEELAIRGIYLLFDSTMWPILRRGLFLGFIEPELGRKVGLASMAVSGGIVVGYAYFWYRRVKDIFY